ncbi:hypothetical protein [Emticicia sp. 17c]|uniref:hypothetical protein n=1 Tax=Emticicia sp. 17c TaxID=3127704 RepID=UPI00301CCF11
MNQYQQIPQTPNDTQLFQMWQAQEFQKWKLARYPYRNQLGEEKEGFNWKWVIAIMLMVVVGVVSFLLFKNRGKLAKPVFQKKAIETEETEVEQPIQKKLASVKNSKKFTPKQFTRIEDQHKDFRDRALADLQVGKQTVEEFKAWMVAEQNFEKINEDFYQNDRLGVEVILMKQGINIHARSAENPKFCPYTEVESLAFRETFLNLIEA